MRLNRWMVAAWAAILVPAALSFGQVMSQVPTNAMIVVHVKNMQELSQKVSALSTELGVPAGATPASDVLGWLSKNLNLKNGVKTDGDFALALIDTGHGMTGQQPPIVMLIPTTDYHAVLSNFPNATTEGTISTVQMPDGNTGYMANWGDYIAISPVKETLSATPGGLTITTAANAQLDSHDICLLVNMPGVRARVLPMMMASRMMVTAQMGMGLRQGNMAKYAPVLRVVMNKVFDVAQDVISQCDDVTVGINLGTDGINATALSDFNSTSHYGQMLASAQNSNASLLAGLPVGKYLWFGGAIADPKVNSQLIGEWLDPILPELQKLGPEGQVYVDYIQGIKSIAAAQSGASFGMVAPEGELGASPMIQGIAVRTGDAKTIATGVAQLLQAQQAQSKANAALGVPMQATFTPAAKTIDGVTFDQFHTGFDMAGALTPQVARIGQILSFAYGQDGMNIYGGVVNDTTYLSVAGLSDDKISAAIAAAKSGTDPLAQLPGVTDTAAKLLPKRMAVMYVPIDTIVNTVFTYLGKFGLDMGVTMPATDPIGMTVSTDASAARMDFYVPGQLLSNGAQVATKLMVHRAMAQPPAAPGGAAAPPAGGGL